MNENDIQASGDEFEEIHSDDVDRVVASLESLMDSVESETIRAYLSECANNIFFLVYDEEDLEDTSSEAA